jgi:Uma2 family endonuclease
MGMSLSRLPSPDTYNGVYYPSSDGKPMAETGIHVLAIMALFGALDEFMKSRPDFYVAATMFWYWEEGNPRARCSPDVMVIRGVDKTIRRSFMSWRENNAVPCVIVEVSSKKTWRIDLGRKRDLYARLGVREYFAFDPDGKYLVPSLQGFRLRDGKLEECPSAPDGSLICEELGVRLLSGGRVLRLLDAQTGAPILTPAERAEKAEAENERLKQLLPRLTQQKNGGSPPALLP